MAETVGPSMNIEWDTPEMGADFHVDVGAKLRCFCPIVTDTEVARQFIVALSTVYH